MHRRAPLVATLALVGVLLVGLTAAANARQPDATPTVAGEGDTGLVTVESPHGVVETMDRLEAAIEEAGAMVVARVDHAANAASADLELRPTQLIIFGNPALGTQLMQANQTVGIDLPQKFLAWEAEDGTVFLGYNDPRYLADRHAIAGPAQEEVLGQVANALAMLAERAIAPGDAPTG